MTACSEKTAQFRAIDITGAEYARDFQLTDHNGQARTLKDFKGKIVVVFFGYTQCPDVCPTTLAELAEVKRSLGADGARLQGVFVTVDPERDTPEVLKAYMGNFDPAFVALRGTREQLVANKFALRDARKELDPEMTQWRGTYVLSALQVLKATRSVREMLRYLRFR